MCIIGSDETDTNSNRKNRFGQRACVGECIGKKVGIVSITMIEVFAEKDLKNLSDTVKSALLGVWYLNSKVFVR